MRGDTDDPVVDFSDDDAPIEWTVFYVGLPSGEARQDLANLVQ
jgi:hypothetical protein